MHRKYQRDRKRAPALADRKKTLKPNQCDVGAGLAINFVGKPITYVQNPPLPMNKYTDNLSKLFHI